MLQELRKSSGWQQREVKCEPSLAKLTPRLGEIGEICRCRSRAHVVKKTFSCQPVNASSVLSFSFVFCSVSAYSTGGRHVGAGRAPSAGETPAAQTAAQRPVLHAEASAAEETREGTAWTVLLVQFVR